VQKKEEKMEEKTKVIEMLLADAVEKKLLERDMYIEILDRYLDTPGLEYRIGGWICHIYPDARKLYIYNPHIVYEGGNKMLRYEGGNKMLRGEKCSCNTDKPTWMTNLRHLARIYLENPTQTAELEAELETENQTIAILQIHRTTQGMCVYVKSPEIAKFLKFATNTKASQM
jgi:hypothetical protein